MNNSISAQVPLVNLDSELMDSRDPVPQREEDDSEELDTLRDLLPHAGVLHRPGDLSHSPQGHKDFHVRFGESQSAPSSPQDKERPERTRFATGGPHHGRGRPRARRFSQQLHRSTSYTLGRMRTMSERTFSAVDPGDENTERGNWSSQTEFFLSCLGYAVGLGNVWRFPYLCHKNGGGAFLIPYFIMLFFCGLPILILELSLGQYSSQGPLTIWKISPLFKGIGCGMVLISIYLAIYYNMITGWAFYYLYNSLTSQLPWRCCDPEWSDSACKSFASGCPVRNDTFAGEEAFDAAETGILAVMNISNITDVDLNAVRQFPSDAYFHKVVLSISSSIDHVGNIEWHLALALLVAWLLVFLVLMRGIKSFGKAVYFTSIFPYFILFILLIRAVIEPGAANGILYFLTPKWERLKDAKVWGDAVSQIFFSTSICTGGVITLSSYNRFHNNCFRDALIIGIGNFLTSLFSGLVVFSILGFMANQQGARIEDIVQGGPGLTFIIYPQAVTLLPISPLWSAMFFLMLITLALSSMFPTVENITTALIDQFTVLRPFKFWVTLVACVALGSAGLALATQAGMYILKIFDRYAVGYALVYIGIAEVLVFAWRYGAHRVKEDIKAMTGIALTHYWTVVWCVVGPILLLFCLIFTWADYEPLKYREKLYPDWANTLGWFMSFTSFAFVPGYAIYLLLDRYMRKPWYGLWPALKELTEPAPDFGPALQKNRPQFSFEPTDGDVFEASPNAKNV